MIYQTGDLVLEKYRIETILGQGALVDVYRVSNLILNIPRVLKVFKRDGLRARDVDYNYVRQRFKQEAQLGGGLNSPNINPYLLQVFDLIDTKDLLALEMEYAPGGNLSNRIMKYKDSAIPFPREKALRFSFEIAAGLASLHAFDIVHRNVTPANILFNQHDHALLADCGLAQLPGGLNQRALLNIQNPHPGSPGYMSPEQRRSSDLLSPSSDVYALGLVLFEVLTGKPYSTVGHRNRLRDSIPGIKLSLDDLVARMLSELPRSRPKDGKAAAVELHRELEAEEQAQQEILGKKRQDYEEWERLKNAEFARQRELNSSNPVVTENVTAEMEEPDLIVVNEKAHPEKEITQEEEWSKPEKPAEELSIFTQADVEHLTSVEEVKVSVNNPPEEKKQASLIQRFWWVGVITILAAALIPYVIGKFAGSQIPMNQVVPPETIKTKLTGIPTSIQTTRLEEVIPSQQSTLALTPTIITTPEVTVTPEPQPTQIPTEIPTEVPALISTKGPTIAPEILMNPGFEESTGWTSKSGDAHILGKFSDNWASEGNISYQIALFGDYSYEYCFTPGMRTTINQNVDLSNVRRIVFDLNVRPPVIKGGFHGEKISISTVAFIDGEQVFTSNEDSTGELRDQEIVLTKPYTGRHDLKFGLMAMSKFCVKGTSEDESLLMNIDNIRFDYQ